MLRLCWPTPLIAIAVCLLPAQDWAHWLDTARGFALEVVHNDPSQHQENHHHHDHHEHHDHHDHHEHDDHRHHHDHAAGPNDAWFYAIGATVLISVAPLLFLPFLRETHNQPVLICFAAGSMLGDVFLHILPDSFSRGHEHHGHDHHGHGEHGHHHSVDDLKGGLAVLGGFLCFFLVEKLVRASRGHGLHSHGHSHGHSPAATGGAKRASGRSPARGGKSKAGSAASAAEPGAELVGYLSLAADAAHNFTDGRAA